MTKKLNKMHILLSCMVFVLAFAIGFQMTNAYVLSRWSSYSDRYSTVVDLATEEDGMVTMTLADLSTATTTILIDKSDIRNFPHIANAPIHISRIAVDWDATDSGITYASTTIKFGVMASSTGPVGTKSDIVWFDRVDFDGKLGVTKLSNVWERNYYPSLVKLDINSGTTTGIMSNDRSLNSTDWATTTKKYTGKGGASTATASGYTGVGLGDLVMDISKNNATADITVSVWYHVKY